MSILAWFRATSSSTPAAESRADRLQVEVDSYSLILRDARERIDRQRRILSAEMHAHEATKRLLGDEQASHQADVARLDAWWSARNANLMSARRVHTKAAKARKRKR